MKSSKVSIKTRSTPASLSIKGQATKHATVKWSIIEICKYETPRFFLRVFHRTFSLYFWTAFLDFCVLVFVSPECPPLYYFAREHWWYCVTVFLRTDWLNVSLLLFQIWYLAN